MAESIIGSVISIILSLYLAYLTGQIKYPNSEKKFGVKPLAVYVSFIPIFWLIGNLLVYIFLKDLVKIYKR